MVLGVAVRDEGGPVALTPPALRRGVLRPEVDCRAVVVDLVEVDLVAGLRRHDELVS